MQGMTRISRGDLAGLANLTSEVSAEKALSQDLLKLGTGSSVFEESHDQPFEAGS